MAPTPAGQALLDAFGRIVIINLPERADRRQAIARELARLGLSLDHPQVSLFRAIRPDAAAGFPSIGAHGAYLSHMAVIEAMLARGDERLLVLEDDVMPAPGAGQRLPALADALAARRWDIVYGHPGTQPLHAPAPDAAGLIALPPELGLIQLHFLGLSARAAQVFLPLLREFRARPPGSPEGGPMHVDGALNWARRLNPDLVALAIAPAIAQQRPSRSDVTARWFDRVPLLAPLAAFARRFKDPA